MRTLNDPAAPSSTIFVGSILDDSGLNVYQFRILGHLHRRAGADGLAWPSIRTIAEVCQIGERVVRRSLRELVNLGHVEAETRPGRSTLYRPAACKPRSAPVEEQAPLSDQAAAPLADRTGAPLADQPAEGIQEKEFPTSTRQPAASGTRTPPERSEPIVVVGCSADRETIQNVKSEPLEADQEAVVDTLAAFGIIGAKRQALARSGLSAKEVRRTCREVRESGGRAGAMIFRLEDLADRKARGKVSSLAKTWKPAEPLPEWQDDMTEAERAEVVEACRKFREAS